jgi:hypothetical protein
MLNRTDPATGPREAFTDTEISVSDRLSPKTAAPEFLPRTLAHYTTQLAKLGAYLARKGGPPPGNTVMWPGHPAYRHRARYAASHKSCG